jgi:hypothetical protein
VAASFTIAMRFADGDDVTVTAEGDDAYPDCLSQLRKEAFDGWCDAVAYALAIQGQPDPE